jgi:hypothetical protein
MFSLLRKKRIEKQPVPSGLGIPAFRYSEIQIISDFSFSNNKKENDETSVLQKNTGKWHDSPI